MKLTYRLDGGKENIMTREFSYRITLLMYSGLRHVHYIKAQDHADAFSKAHRFSNPLAQSHHDGVQFINVDRITKQYCKDHRVVFE